jgi:superfamily I DNA/RNA helicase
MSQLARVALSSDFLGAFAKLPQGVQNKVSKFLTNFQRDPTASGINYERINAARDPNMRSVRIDEAWRGIVLKPEQGNLYLLLWVDRHDDAYAWASKHRCTINGATGAIQVFEAVLSEEPIPEVPAAEQTPPLFETLSDRELTLLGVPDDLLARVRAACTEESLDALQSALPAEAYEGLFLIAAGDTLSQILQERETRVDQTVDTSDFDTALEKAESQSRFVVVDNETELAGVLNASLAQWRVFLHPSQHRLVQGVKSGPVRVLGGAGTGKTVVAMHRAKWLADHWLPENNKILFTTFTKNLAVDIHANLKELCGPQTLARIEVVNLDAWVRRFLRQRSYEYEIVWDKEDRLWELAMGIKPAELPVADSFYREEWQRVIQPQGIETLDDYKRASRVGRGTTLPRSARIKVWPVFEEYRSRMIEAHKKEVEDAYRDAASLLTQDRSALRYASVIVDEAQDMGPQAFRLLRALVEPGPNDLFIVGDGHQRIYGRNRVVLSRCGIDIRGRARKLRVNYRTTEEIRRAAVALLEGCTVDDLDGGEDTQKGYKSLTHGERPEHRNFGSAEEQAQAIVGMVHDTISEGTPAASTCIVARSNQELDDLERRLAAAGISTQRIRTEEAESGTRDAIRLATMHRVKGLEFDCMIVASVNKGQLPPRAALETTDPVERAVTDLEERSLLYVALTRARRRAYLLSYGEPSVFLAAG